MSKFNLFHSAKPVLSMALPFYNEEAGAASVISNLEAALEADKINYELILVDNGSGDDTNQILHQFAEKNPRISVVKVDVNQGYGWGIIQGLESAHGEYLGYMCGDGQISPQDLVRVFDTIRKQPCDVAKVWRQSRHDGLQRKFVSSCYNFLFSAIFGVRAPDINGTPKIFHKKHWETFGLKSKDWFIDAELMIKAQKMNLKVSHVPVVFFKREKGRSNVRWKTIGEFLVNIVKHRLGGGK